MVLQPNLPFLFMQQIKVPCEGSWIQMQEFYEEDHSEYHQNPSPQVFIIIIIQYRQKT